MSSSQTASNGESAAPPARSPASTAARHSRRMLFGLLLASMILLIAAAVFLQMFVAQRIPVLTDAELEAAEELWNRTGPSSYDMDLEIRGARPGTVHIEVRNAEITALTRDRRTPAQHTWRYWSVPGLFETLEQEMVLAEDPVHEMGAAAGTQLRLRCDFDPVYGYPRRYHRHVSGGGPEVYWRVTNFTPR